MYQGADELGKIISEGLKKIKFGLIGQDTEFCWISSGHTESSEKSTIAHVDEVKREVFMVAHPRPGDQTCKEVYRETTRRHEDGKDTAENPQTPEIRDISRSRQPQEKFNVKLEQHLQYSYEYPKLGHMEKVLSTEIDHGQFHIPHQAAIQE
ncbi:hypothetical protein JTB14_016180 [Gonioctena quinquepunctata]|nr:hypothetical protein JTB14_016180 [Gonioctena quinquepunctata]